MNEEYERKYDDQRTSGTITIWNFKHVQPVKVENIDRNPLTWHNHDNYSSLSMQNMNNNIVE